MDAVGRIAKMLNDPNTGDPLIEGDCYIFSIENSGDNLHGPCGIVADKKNQLVNVDNEIIKIIFNDEEENACVEYGSQNKTTTEVIAWPEEQTKLLIEMYKTFKPLVEQGKLKTLKRMREKIKFEMGYLYSTQQIENKWKSLARAYKNKKENNKKTGRGRKSCSYEKQLDEIVSKWRSISPLCTLGVEDDCSKNAEKSIDMPLPQQADTECSDTSSRRSTPKTITKRRSSNKNSVMRELQELRTLILEKKKTKLEMEREKCKERQEIIDQLKKKNELLEKLLNKQ